jgi:outer membrane cobalamin receptor
MNSETSFNKTKIALAVALASSILPYTNQANADESATLEGIVVTATRRDECERYPLQHLRYNR